MILDMNNREIANWSQVTVAFDNETDYNAWVNTLPNRSADVSKFVVFKCWENQTDRAVQFYRTSAIFPPKGNTNTIYLDITAWQMYSYNTTTNAYEPLGTGGGNANMVVGTYNELIGLIGDPQKLYYAYDTHELMYWDADAGVMVKFLGVTGDNPVIFVNSLPTQGGIGGVLYVDISSNLLYRWGDNRWQLIGHENSDELVFFDTFPTSGEADKLYIDNVDGIIYRWKDDKFVAISDTGYKISFVTELPSYGQDGILYINTTNRKLYFWNGTRFTILCANGVSGSSGDYTDLINTPFINGFEVKPGNQDGHDLGLANWVDLLNLQQIMDHLYNAEYTTYDYEAAKEYFEKYDPDIASGGCSTFVKQLGSNGRYMGRNYDYNYNETAEYVVRTKAVGNKHATLGNAEGSTTLTDYVASSGKPDLFYEILPYLTADGINDAGLVVSMNIVSPEDACVPVDCSGTNKGVAGCTRVAGTAVPRYLLDYCDSAYDAVDYIKNKLDIFMINTTNMQLVVHYLIADANNTFIVEVDNNQVYVLVNGGSTTYPGAIDLPSTNIDKNNHRQIMTNFLLHKWNGDIKTVALGNTVDETKNTGLTLHSWGIERYKIIDEAYDDIASVDDIKATLKSIDYTNAYKTETEVSPTWYSEFNEGTLTILSNQAAYASVLAEERNLYQHRSRKTGLTWHTVHNAVYDINSRTMLIRTQENTTDEWKLEVLTDSSGVSSYNYLTDKPTLNGVEIIGDKTAADYNLMNTEDINALLTGRRSIVRLESWPPEHPVANTLYYVPKAGTDNIYDVWLQGTYPEGAERPEDYAINMGSTETDMAAYQRKQDTSILVEGANGKVVDAINMLYNTYINGTRVIGNLSGNDLHIDGNVISKLKKDFPAEGDTTKVYYASDEQKLYKYTGAEHGYMEIVSPSGIACDTLANILAGVQGKDTTKIYYATDTQDIYKCDGTTFSIAANFAQPTVVFDTEESYNDWKALITTRGESIDDYVVFQNWEVDSPVQCYYDMSYFPTVGRKHTIYIDCTTRNQYLWHYQTQEYILLNEFSSDSGTGTGSGSSSGTPDYAAILKQVYPIGSIYMSMASTDPQYLFGGTWQLIAPGRVLVGIDTTKTNYNAAGKTGGSETVTLTTSQLPTHNHSVELTGSLSMDDTLVDQSGLLADIKPGYRAGCNEKHNLTVYGPLSYEDDNIERTRGEKTYHKHKLNNSLKISQSNVGSGNAHNNMQPYFTCYIWQRTA